VEEVADQSSIDVAFRRRDQRDVVVSRVNKADSRQLDHWGFLCCLCGDDFVAEVHYLGATVKVQSTICKLYELGILTYLTSSL
jgi:hypothetical protein